MWLTPSNIVQIRGPEAERGDIVIARNIHYRYPNIYNGYISTIHAVNSHNVTIKNTEGTWDLNYDNSTWRLLETSPAKSIEDINPNDVIMMPNLKLYWVRKIDVKGKILLVSFRYASNDTLAIRYEEGIRVCDYSLTLEDKNILRLGYKDGIYRYHEIFNTMLIENVMYSKDIIEMIALKTHSEIATPLNKEDAIDFIIKNFNQE